MTSLTKEALSSPTKRYSHGLLPSSDFHTIFMATTELRRGVTHSFTPITLYYYFGGHKARFCQRECGYASGKGLDSTDGYQFEGTVSVCGWSDGKDHDKASVLCVWPRFELVAYRISRSAVDSRREPAERTGTQWVLSAPNDMACRYSCVRLKPSRCWMNISAFWDDFGVRIFRKTRYFHLNGRTTN